MKAPRLLAILLSMLCSISLSNGSLINPYFASWYKFRSRIGNVLSQPMCKDDGNIVLKSDIRSDNRTIWIITTAAIPWLTGTAVNPLLRAAFLAKNRPKGKVHLLVPWVPPKDQLALFSSGELFQSPHDQLKVMRDWLIEDSQLVSAASKLSIDFYPGMYHHEYHSIFPVGDITDLISDKEADVCILEEPEHLNWFRAPFKAKDWMNKFQHVVGIIHTNYLMYIRSRTLGQLAEPVIYFINQVLCRAYCHKVIKLSAALQEFAVEKEVVCNVHGVREQFLQIGDKSKSRYTKGAYFVGKMAWPKGLRELFKLMTFLQKRTGSCFPIDVYGCGPDQGQIEAAAKKAGLPVTFYGGVDHSTLSDYRVFVNPSLSEVLCTTIDEALAMGKWVVCPKHPSTAFFDQFPNCLMYTNPEEFAADMHWALSHDPYPLSSNLRYTLSWEAATERLLLACMVTKGMERKSNFVTDRFLAWMIDTVGSREYLRELIVGQRHPSMDTIK